MKRYPLWSAMILLFISCKQSTTQDVIKVTEEDIVCRIFSKNVLDSFSVFVHLPNNYDPQQKERYPVVYLLDANLYFDIMATTLDKYSEVGLAPAAILIGIGYKDFPTMDSLRNRDDTYPVAIPEYEMSVSGGASKFLDFIEQELVPIVDQQYKTDTLKRVLMGHSLAGYFTDYALLQNLEGKSNSFSGYIAASPSLHYNNYYLLKQFNKTPSSKKTQKIKSYISYGGKEDEGSPDDSSTVKLPALSLQLSKLLSEKQSAHLTHKTDIYSNLGHMDTQIPGFLKGLNYILGDDQ